MVSLRSFMTQKSQTNPTNKPVVAVFGATGHTGRFVIAELLRREMTPIAIARKALSEAEFPENVVRRQATVDVPFGDAGNFSHGREQGAELRRLFAAA